MAAAAADNTETVSQYVQEKSTNTQLFSILALLNAYVPDSYLLMSECQQILGPPDPIHGGPPFEERMEPFTDFINTSNPNPGHVGLIHQMIAQSAVVLLDKLGISRSATAMELMVKLCGNSAQQYLVEFIKDLLTKREMGENGKDKFSRLIKDILENENFYDALRVLMNASNKFQRNPIFPQVVARLNYVGRNTPDYRRAEKWAKKAIQRAPGSSYMADTLGQIYKNRLMSQRNWQRNRQIVKMVDEAFAAFKDVEMKAEREEGPEMEGDGTVNTSTSFNNRGLYGFIQIAKIAFEKFDPLRRTHLVQNKRREVEATFTFFEWYLTVSKPNLVTLEPPYFWKDVANCYRFYTTESAADSTNFSGLLDCLNHGLFMSKGKRARFQEDETTGSDLEAIQADLEVAYEENADDVKVAERYILSNIILSNRMPDSPQLTPVTELQAIIQRFLGAERRRRSPEFYLLVLLLFWPEGRPPVVQDEVEEEAGRSETDDNSSGCTSSEVEDSNEEQETQGEPATQVPPNHVFESNLQQHVTFMEMAFERAKYAKYLRGRYLLPLFFLGKRSGLSKWIHKSTLDAIVEGKVDANLVDERHKRNIKKVMRINDMWLNGEVWQLPEIQDILLPVRVEPCQPCMLSQDQEEQEVFVCAGGQRMKASVEIGPDASVLSTLRFYLGFNIRGPVVFRVGVPDFSEQ